MRSRIDMTGRRFGKLVARRPLEVKGGQLEWECQCDCGRVKAVKAGNLRKANGTKSCGCLTEHHGFTPRSGWRPEYRTFQNAKRRCRDPKHDAYEYYGGRGIEFRFSSFMQFYKELGPRPEGYSIDRKDVNGHYEPGNVRWAKKSTQMKNRRKWGKCA